MIKFLLILILLIPLVSCGGIKSGATGKAGKYHESFYLGEGKNQFFVKALEFENDDTELKIDFTIRDFEFKDSASTANFTLISEYLVPKIDSVCFFFDDKQSIMIHPSRMFFEKKGSDYIIRNTMKLNHTLVEQFFGCDKLSIILKSGDKTFSFVGDNSTRKVRNYIYTDLIEIIKHY